LPESNSDSFADSDGYIHADANSDSHGDIHTDTDCDCNVHAYSHSYSYSDSNSYGNGHCDHLAAAYTHATAATNAAAASEQLLFRYF
jgi:hypothetical protein